MKREDSVRAVELLIGELPGNYRNWLLESFASLDGKVFEAESLKIEICHTLNVGFSYPSITAHYEVLVDEGVTSLVPIATDTGNNFICLLGTEVVWLDHRGGELQERMKPIADDFSVFLSSLRDGKKREQDRVHEFAKRYREGDELDLDLVGRRSNYAATLLEVAAKIGNIALVRLCIDKGVTGERALHLAVSEARLEVVQFLLSEGDWPINGVDKQGATALDWCDHPEICSLLEAHGFERRRRPN